MEYHAPDSNLVGQLRCCVRRSIRAVHRLESATEAHNSLVQPKRNTSGCTGGNRTFYRAATTIETFAILSKIFHPYLPTVSPLSFAVGMIFPSSRRVRERDQTDVSSAVRGTECRLSPRAQSAEGQCDCPIRCFVPKHIRQTYQRTALAALELELAHNLVDTRLVGGL